MSEIITVKDMCLWYSQTQALKNININIEDTYDKRNHDREYYFFLQRNGAESGHNNRAFLLCCKELHERRLDNRDERHV